MSQSIGGIVGLPPVKTLRPESSPVHDVGRPAANTDNAILFHPDVDAASVRTQDACGLDPPVRLFCDPVVDSLGPLFGADEWRSVAPNVLHAISTLWHPRPRLRCNAPCNKSLLARAGGASVSPT